MKQRGGGTRRFAARSKHYLSLNQRQGNNHGNKKSRTSAVCGGLHRESSILFNGLCKPLIFIDLPCFKPSDNYIIVIMDGFNIRKAAQIAAFFAKAEGGRINVLKLVKLVYLADRKFIERYDSTMLHDKLISMDHGPVNSVTLNLINGLAADPKGDWGAWITERDGHFVALLNRDVTVDDLDELSDAEIETLSEIATQFKGWSQYRVRDYTHKHCPEWQDPDGSSLPIPYEKLFTVLGKTDPEALAEAVEEERQVTGMVFAD